LVFPTDPQNFEHLQAGLDAFTYGYGSEWDHVVIFNEAKFWKRGRDCYDTRSKGDTHQSWLERENFDG
jgi:hypothetical protein